MPDGHDPIGGRTREERRPPRPRSARGAPRRPPAGSRGRPATLEKASRRRTRGVVRKIDAWSVMKVSIIFYITLYCILLIAAVLLWSAASATGLRSNVEKFIADLIASGKFHFVGGELFRASAIAGAVLVVMGTGANVLGVVLYNLISDLVGGITVVVEERPTRRAARAVAGDAPDVPPPPPPLIPEAELRQARSPGAGATGASPPPTRPVAAATAVPPPPRPGPGSGGPIAPSSPNL